MEKMQRAFIYAMLSNIFSDSLNEKEINDFKNNKELLSVIGEASKEYFNSKSVEEIKEELNVDFTTTFLVNAHPIESAVTDLKQDVLVGLQNPVMQFYYKYGYDVNLLNTEIQVPDHLAIELGFMQNLVLYENSNIQFTFLKMHIINWVIPYFVGIKKLFSTPFYQDIVDFSLDFILSEYEYLKSELK